MLVGQSRNGDSPFEIIDMSIKEANPDWKNKARTRIKGCDVVVVICGEKTDKASGVSIELEIAQDEDVSYFLLWGRSDKKCVKPNSAKESDIIYKWTWENLKKLFNW